MNPEENSYIREWIKKGEDDLTVADLIMTYKPLVLDVACFHCQQAVEKFLKAYLIYKKVDFPRVHQLDLLRTLCIQHEKSFTEFEVGDLV